MTANSRWDLIQTFKG